VDSDIVLANDQGEIGVVTFGKYLTLQKNAHRGVINCLRVTDMISKVRVFKQNSSPFIEIINHNNWRR